MNRGHARRGERAGARVRGCSGAGARGLATEWRQWLSSRAWGTQLRVRHWVTGLSGMASRPAGPWRARGLVGREAGARG